MRTYDLTDLYPRRRLLAQRLARAYDRRGVWTVPRTWASGELVTALMMNTHVRDNLNAVKGFLPNTFRGLHLRTHPDADKAANQVSLLNLDEVVMSDGIKYASISQLPLSADITASGAGGLDTGSRTASKWYEIYLIGKSTTQANSDLRLILHRAKEYDLDQSQTTSGTAAPLRTVTSQFIKRAQSFTVGTAGLCEFIDTHLAKVGSPIGRVWFTIEADNSNKPSNTPLATSDKFDVSKLSSSEQAIRVPFRSPASLIAATKYWLVFQGDWTASDTNYVQQYFNAAGGYASGDYANSTDGTAWSVTAVDAWFKTYVTVTNGALTFPTGYDESCKLGYVYNNGSNALIPFVAMDKASKAAYGDAATSAIGSNLSGVTLTDLSAGYLPPGPIKRVIVLGQNTSASINEAAIGGVPGGFDQADSFLPGGTRADVPQNGIGPIETSTEYQAVYLLGATGANAFYFRGYEWT